MRTLKWSLSPRLSYPLPHVSNSFPACWYGQLQRSRCNRRGFWCACFSSSTLQLRKPSELSSLSGDGQAVAHRGRSLYVSFLERSDLYFVAVSLIMTQSLIPAGNSSLPLNMNGMSSGDVSRIGGQYGFVAVLRFCFLCREGNTVASD
jgi:hypothetical protein